MGKRMGAQIKKARLDAGLTQEKLAQKVGGVTAQDISKAERGVLVCGTGIGMACTHVVEMTWNRSISPSSASANRSHGKSGS